MMDLTQIEIEIIIGLSLAVISVAANQAGTLKPGETILNRFFAVVLLLAICGVSYHAYVQSRDVVFAAIAVIAALLLLFFFIGFAARRK